MPAKRYESITPSFALLLILSWAISGQSWALSGIIKSANDQRIYENFVLPNGMKAIVISDPTTDKAAASLDVGIGSGSDPENFQGLAHFLEHMLFLGTEKYPTAGEYQAYIASHGGNHNAFTAFDRTNYFFDVNRDSLEPALDRFAQFFVSPLFTEAYVEREKNAVHSEYQSKIKEDGWRGMQAFKTALNPEHPLASFSTGSLETLSDKSDQTTREALLEFYAQHYSSNLMSVVVLGREPVDQLKAWVTEKFSPVPNRNGKRLSINVPMFKPGSLPARMNIVPQKEQRELSLSFPVPGLDPHYLSKPAGYIGHLLGHEGKGSLLSLLKQRGWADGLSAGRGLGADKEDTIGVSVTLTKEGLEKVDEITGLVFQYVNLVREKGVEDWLFEEQRQLSEIGFRFQEIGSPSHYVTGVAAGLQEYPLADVLRASYAMDEYKPALIREYLAAIRPDNVLVAVTAPGLETDQIEPIYQTPYSFKPISAELVKSWSGSKIDTALVIPERNAFVPENLALLPEASATDKPVRLDSSNIELWYQQDSEFRVPKADFYFSVRTPQANSSARNGVLTSLYADLINDQLNEFAYPARLAGLNYNLYKHIRGFAVRISGYSDKQDVVLAKILDTLSAPEFKADRFNLFKRNYERAIRNAALEKPYDQTISDLRTLLMNPAWTNEETLAALKPLELADLQAFAPTLLEKVELAALSHGNVSVEATEKMAGLLQESLLSNAEAVITERARVTKLERGNPYIRDLNIDHGDSAITVYFQGEKDDMKNRARYGLLSQILAPAFFNDLRTEKQLGYVVFASAMPILEVPGLIFTVQSPNTNPQTIGTHIQAFLKNESQVLAGMSDTELEKQKQGLIGRLLEKDKNLSERTGRYWNDIDDKRYNFDTRNQLAAEVAAITKEDLSTFFRQELLSDQRRQLTVQTAGSTHTGAANEKGDTVISDVQSFKSGKAFYPG